MAQSSSLDNRKLSYAQRATKTIHPLSDYLLRLMTLKKSNLCFSADVSTTKQLLSLAENVGPSIVVLKTHYDLISNWDYNPSTGTGARLAKLARRYGFLIFEDRKLADIGNTVQIQYSEGTARIIEWSHIVNVNMLPGKASVEALAASAARWKNSKHYEVKTDISAGNLDSTESSTEEYCTNFDKWITRDMESRPLFPDLNERKSSIVSITTVSQHFEPANSPWSNVANDDESFEGIEEAPMDRGLLILAQMSSEGNLATKDYTDACVKAARDYNDYVMGFVSQECLNTEVDDHFLNFTPGCQLPPQGVEKSTELSGDGKGQQYRTPSRIIGDFFSDIIIVGRGIIDAVDPVLEAERYRASGWEAYESRIAPA